MSRFGSLGTQYFDDSGDPLISGKIYVYEPGTLTAKDTYADSAQTTANTNPIVLTAAGRQPNVFFSGSAKVILTDSDDVQIEVRDPVGGDETDAAFADWNTDAVYNQPDIVTGSDGNFYISITDSNTGNDPTSDTTNWTRVRLIRVWNTNETYAAGDVAQGSDNLLYVSNTGSNVGNDPTSDAVNWKSAATATIPPAVQAAGYIYAQNNF